MIILSISSSLIIIILKKLRKLKHTVEVIRADSQLSLTGENFTAYTEELLIVLYLANASIKSQ